MSSAPQVEPWPDRDFVRVATFNIQELDRGKIFTTDDEGTGIHPQARAAATIIQRVRPDVIVLNELDHYYGQGIRGLSAYAHRFAELYLENGEAPIKYPYVLIDQQHGHSQRPGPEQRRRHGHRGGRGYPGARRRFVRVRPVPGSVLDGGPVPVSHGRGP